MTTTQTALQTDTQTPCRGRRTRKNGQVVDIPIRSRAIVLLRFGRNGELTDRKGIVLRLQKPSDFSRAYGRQAYVWTEGRVWVCGAGDLYPIGVAKRVPQVCRQALAEYLAVFPEE